MAQEKKTDRNPKDCGQLHGENTPPEKHRLDFWYPRIMAVALSLNLLLQILILVLHWYRL